MRYRSAGRLGPDAVGRRVTVRRRLPEGGASDTVGVLVALDERHATVRNAAGADVVIAVEEIVAARVIAPPSPR